MKKLLNSELERKSLEDFKKAQKLPVVLVLDNVRSLNNVGSIFRTADAFLVQSIYLCGITACPPHRDIQKTALGATESVDWFYYKKTSQAIHELKRKGFQVISIEQVERSIFLDDFQPDFKQKYTFVFGHEIRGVDQEIVDLSDASIEIPQYGIKHSFNISISAGIVLWHYHIKTRSHNRVQ